MTNRLPIEPDTCVIAIVKKDQKFIFVFHDNADGRHDVLCALGRAASNPELTFTWYEAAVLSQKVRRGVQNQSEKFQIPKGDA